ncbi:MAG TPA: response regulator [Steroidobacteraceae bacterium]|jgi:CheY-like chemotaxis protein|nr:response regulator [Steroidobacteraceae bacterium]
MRKLERKFFCVTLLRVSQAGFQGAGMGAKRALIVDDSKSARVFLARILEKYEIDVDNAENAEAAIEYLGTHRPDVIFMDHMMPGMDGFQAVQAIKNNPRTATIPILMYTSQEGELYLGQARALGAVGVLPKQIKPADVSKVLYQLHLVADRRTTEQSSFKQVNLEAVDNSAPGAAPPGSKPLTDTALREQFAELRRALVASIDTQSERITSDVRMLLQDAMPNFAPPRVPESRAPWMLASLALLVALASAGLWWHEARLRQDLVAQLADLQRATIAATQASAAAAANAEPRAVAAVDDATDHGTAELTPEGAAPMAANRVLPAGTSGFTRTSTGPLEDHKTLVLPVPYGDDALAGPRLETIRQMMKRLAARDVRGVVEVRTFPGRFCLVGNATEGFSVAPDELPYSRCNAIANPHEDALQPAQRESLAFANLAGEFRHETRGALDLQLSPGDATNVVAAYPSISSSLTAGEWNRAAAANNRIEVRLR